MDLFFYDRSIDDMSSSRRGPAARIDRSIYQFADTLPSPDPQWPTDVRVLLSALHRRLVEPGLRLAKVRQALGLHDHNVTSRFAYYVGQRPWSYVVTRRMELAKQLLADEALRGVPIGQIALAVGYASPSGFATVFKRKVGCTPSAYRVAARRADGRAEE